MYIRKSFRARSALTPFLLIFAFILAGCGGGGGGSGGSSGVNANLPAYPVNAASARTATGGTALARTSAQISAELEALNQSADSLLIGDNHFFFADGSSFRADTRCAGASCTTSAAGESVTLSLANFDFSASSDSEYQAVMTRNDISLAQGRSRTSVGGEQTDVLGYGGWLDDSFFFAYALTETGGAIDFTVGYGLSAGNATGRNPAAAGGATWSGVMVGADVGASAGNVIQGDATIDIDDFNNPAVDIAFTNIVDLDAGTGRGDMRWDDISLRAGEFAMGSGGNQIQGQFYGASGDEVGGTFERSNVVGAFGAAR